MSFNPVELLEDVKNAPSIDALELVDESDFPLAPNFLEFSVSPKFLNTRILPRQIQIGLNLFADFCPDCSKPGYVDTLFDQSIGNIKDNVQLLEHGVCPKCKQTRFQLIKSGKLLYHNELVASMGQRSGKTKLTGIASAYLTHRIVKLPNPLKDYNLPNGEWLLGTFAALTLEQAKDTLWDSYIGFVEGSPWFNNYHEFLKQEGKRLGKELFSRKATSLLYNHKHINVHATGSQDRKMRGKTRFLACIDELGWFISEEGKNLQNMNADGVYTALSNSLATLKMKYLKVWGEDNFNIPPPLMCNVSSPSAAKDKIMRLYKQSKVNPRMYGVNLPTWEANPDYSEEALRVEYSSMSEDVFMRDFGAEPPLNSNPYISDPRSIDRIATGFRLHGLEAVETVNSSDIGDRFKSVNTKVSIPDKTTPRLVTFDLGATKNALAVCIFTLEGNKPALEFALNLRPDKTASINLAHFFDHFTSVIVEKYNIKYAFFDRWQSMDQIHRLRQMGVDASSYSMTYKDMDMVRGTAISQGTILPKIKGKMKDHIERYIEDDTYSPDPIILLGIQLMIVRDLGQKLTKPLVGDDDIFRAWCLGVFKMMDSKVKKMMEKKVATSAKGTTLGSVRNRGGGVIRGKRTCSVGLIHSMSKR